MSEEILKPIDVMNNDELIAILTIKKDNFNDEFRNKIVNELDKRGVKLNEILNVAKVPSSISAVYVRASASGSVNEFDKSISQFSPASR